MTPTNPIAAVPAQPDALFYASALENCSEVDFDHIFVPAAAVIRRLHAQVAALTASQGAAERAVPAEPQARRFGGCPSCGRSECVAMSCSRSEWADLLPLSSRISQQESSMAGVCDKAPPGLLCTRQHGHSGPCAAELTLSARSPDWIEGYAAGVADGRADATRASRAATPATPIAASPAQPAPEPAPAQDGYPPLPAPESYGTRNGRIDPKQPLFTEDDMRDYVRADRAARAPVAAAPGECTVTVPPGYQLVLVPDEDAPDEPDWEEVQRQAEVVTGIKVQDWTMPILIREVRRWIAHKDGTPAQPAPAATADALDSVRLDWLLLSVSGAEFRRIGVHYSGNARRSDIDAALAAQQKDTP